MAELPAACAPEAPAPREAPNIVVTGPGVKAPALPELLSESTTTVPSDPSAHGDRESGAILEATPQSVHGEHLAAMTSLVADACSAGAFRSQPGDRTADLSQEVFGSFERAVEGAGFSDAAWPGDGPPAPSLDEWVNISEQLGCSEDEAIEIFKEIPIQLVMSDLRCGRRWASELLSRHGWMPDEVMEHETNRAVLEEASISIPGIRLQEIRTSWGTTVPYNLCCAEGEDPPLIFEFKGRRLKILLCSETYAWLFKPGDVVMIEGLSGAAALNGRMGTIRRWIHDKMRYEVTVHGAEGTKGLKDINLTNFALWRRS